MKKAFAISLALLILASNLSIALSTHYCGGKAVKSAISVGNYDLDCGMTDMESCEPKGRGFNEILPIPCCQNSHSFFKINEEYSSPAKVQFAFLSLLVFDYFIPSTTSLVFTSAKILLRTYKPPLPKQAKAILFQVFRL